MEGQAKMPDIETVAVHLYQLDRAAEQHAGTIGVQRYVGEQRSTKRPKVQIYEKCAALLDDAEREALDRIIEKMMPAARLPVSTGSIVPP
jgi:hypothetical protein